MRLYFSFLFFFLLSCSQSTLTLAVDWKILKEGLSYKKLAIEIEDSVVDLHAFKVEPQKYSFKILKADSNEVSSTVNIKSTVKDMAVKENSILAVNSNFFDENGKTLGLAVNNKTIVNPFKKISWWAVFSIINNRPLITHSSVFNVDTTTRMQIGLQAGPRLVINGIIPKLKDETSAKVVLGITYNDEIIIAATQNPISILKLAQILSEPEKRGGLFCRDALNLDGGSSTQLYAKVGSFELNLPAIVRVPMGFGVFENE